LPQSGFSQTCFPRLPEQATIVRVAFSLLTISLF
jgi:hypothetical protein